MYGYDGRVECCNWLVTGSEHIKNTLGIYTHCFLLLLDRRSPSLSNIPSSNAMLLYVVSEGAAISNLFLKRYKYVSNVLQTQYTYALTLYSTGLSGLGETLY
jgi:hypothetical protein